MDHFPGCPFGYPPDCGQDAPTPSRVNSQAPRLQNALLYGRGRLLKSGDIILA